MDLAQARRHAVLCEFIRPYQSHEDVGGFDTEAMADRIVRLERILHALREPSEAVKQSMLYEYGPGQFVAFHRTRLVDALNAAVAAAEEEVGDA